MPTTTLSPDLLLIYVSGPDHGGPAVVANTYLEGTYSEIYLETSRDEAGLQKHEAIKLNREQRNFRIFGPDETLSNRLNAVFEVTNRQWQEETRTNDEFLARDTSASTARICRRFGIGGGATPNEGHCRPARGARIEVGIEAQCEGRSVLR